MIRIVIDTNVVISAILFGGKLHEIIEKWQNKEFVFLLTTQIFDEYIKVLSYPKFSLELDEIRKIIYEEILPYTEIVKTKTKINLIQQDPSDNIFLECAQAGGADYIVSGDEHLLNLKKFGRIKIVTPDKIISLWK